MTARRTGDPIPAEHVKQLREELGLTQAELAERLGVRGGKSVISTWENGRSLCDGPAAELILLLLGSRSLSLGMAALLDDMEKRWTEFEGAHRHWRQVTILPADDVHLGRDRLLTLFPDAAVPIDQHAHGFPFVNVSDTRPFSVVNDGWVGTLPHNSSVPISYLWRFSANGGFSYREKVWEVGQELGPTGGHVFIGALFDMVTPAFELYRRLAPRLGWSTMRITARLDLAGVRGRGLSAYSSAGLGGPVFSLPPRTSSDDRWTGMVTAPLPVDQTGVVASAVALVGEVTAAIRPELARTADLLAQLRLRWEDERNEKYRRLQFLPKLGDIKVEAITARIRDWEKPPVAVPSTRRAQRAVLEYLERDSGIYQQLGADAGWASRFKISSTDLLADVIWYLAWRGFIEISTESKRIRPLLERMRQQGASGDSVPAEFVQAIKHGLTDARITTLGGDHLYALRREAPAE